LQGYISFRYSYGSERSLAFVTNQAFVFGNNLSLLLIFIIKIVWFIEKPWGCILLNPAFD
jgi:hypothetical protein